MKDCEIKQNEYKKSIEVLNEIIDRKLDNVFENTNDNEFFKKQLESLRCSKELIEEDIPYLDPSY